MRCRCQDTGRPVKAANSTRRADGMHNVFNRPVQTIAMVVCINVLLGVFVAVSAVAFAIGYYYPGSRCNPEFNGQLHCLSGIILCNRPFFGFVMHCVGGMVLLSNGLKIETKNELSMSMLAMIYISFSGVINFDVLRTKPVHFAFLFAVLCFSMAFVWLQCVQYARLVYTGVSVGFICLILFNVSCTGWVSPWMNVQALMEIVWVLCLLVCIVFFSVDDLQ